MMQVQTPRRGRKVQCAQHKKALAWLTSRRVGSEGEGASGELTYRAFVFTSSASKERTAKELKANCFRPDFHHKPLFKTLYYLALRRLWMSKPHQSMMKILGKCSSQKRQQVWMKMHMCFQSLTRFKANLRKGKAAKVHTCIWEPFMSNVELKAAFCSWVCTEVTGTETCPRDS